MIKTFFFSSILFFLISLPILAQHIEKKVCFTRFDPTHTDFSFEIKPMKSECNSNEKSFEIKKEHSGVWVFFPIGNENLENTNEEKYEKRNSINELQKSKD